MYCNVCFVDFDHRQQESTDLYVWFFSLEKHLFESKKSFAALVFELKKINRLSRLIISDLISIRANCFKDID